MSRYQLQRSARGLCLKDTFSRQRPVLVDFASAPFRYRLRKDGGRQELLAKAVGARNGLQVVDCTAGLGRDAFTLATLGCEVTMIERSVVMACLLEDALCRSGVHSDLAETVSRIHLIRGDAISLVPDLPSTPDVMLIDPMFPSRVKSARVKGEMQVLQRFLGVDEDAEALLAAALDSGCPRVVFKRPVHDRSLPQIGPTYSLKGSSVRFDVFAGSTD